MSGFEPGCRSKHFAIVIIIQEKKSFSDRQERSSMLGPGRMPGRSTPQSLVQQNRRQGCRRKFDGCGSRK